MKAAIAFDQPKLRAARDGHNIFVRGSYLLFENGAIANPAGPISEFDIEMVLPRGYPNREPKVFEVGSESRDAPTATSMMTAIAASPFGSTGWPAPEIIRSRHS